MYTYKPRTIAEIKADIADLKATPVYDDDMPDKEDDLDSLYQELDEALKVEAEADQADQGRSGNLGLDLTKVRKAFCGIPKEWDEGFLP